MKLIIDIPQEVYDHARSMSQDGQDEAQAMRAIANGKVSFCRWLSTENVKQACIEGPCEREKITNPCIECGGNACRAIMDGKTCNAMYYSAQPRGEWIPLHFDSGSKCVSDFPNEMDGKLVIVTDGKRVSVERIKKDAYDHFFPYGTFFELEDVVAWMPLPEPYQKEGEQK